MLPRCVLEPIFITRLGYPGNNFEEVDETVVCLTMQKKVDCHQIGVDLLDSGCASKPIFLNLGSGLIPRMLRLGPCKYFLICMCKTR